MQTNDPLVAYRLGAIRVGIQATVLALLELAVFRLLPGHGSASWGPYLGILALGLLSTGRWARGTAGRAAALFEEVDRGERSAQGTPARR